MPPFGVCATLQSVTPYGVALLLIHPYNILRENSIGMKKKVIYSPRYIRNLPQWSLQALHDYLVNIYPLMDNHWAQCALGNGGHPNLPITENQFYFMNKLAHEKADRGEPLICNFTPTTGHIAHDGKTKLDQFHQTCFFCEDRERHKNDESATS
tara:strand:+ start:723 stop:1184 length:462 start_codon:yes stop_codon:yes gene_type:complete